MVRDDGIPYYFIWLTNWTGMVTAVYAVLHAWATRRAARLRDDQDAGDATEIPRGVHALWALKCIAPVAQLLITTVYWGVLWRPQYAVEARGGGYNGGAQPHPAASTLNLNAGGEGDGSAHQLRTATDFSWLLRPL